MNSDFRWPSKDDVPFVTSPIFHENTRIAINPEIRNWQIRDGYKSGADLMVTKSVNDRALRDSLVFPIIFNYRHYLELSLKYLINAYGPAVQVTPDLKSHNLERLWQKFLSMSKEYVDEEDEATPEVGRIIREFGKIDPKSFAYRYPVDTEGTPISIENTELYLPALKIVMEGVSCYFDGCDGYFDNLLGASGWGDYCE